jgi:hypothetical protein
MLMNFDKIMRLQLSQSQVIGRNQTLIKQMINSQEMYELCKIYPHPNNIFSCDIA